MQEVNTETGILKRKFVPEKIRNDYSKVAWFYDFWSRITESKAGDWLVNHANLNGNLKILDVGTGTGMMLKRIAALNRNGMNTGLDISPEMLKRAGKNMLKTGYPFELKEGSAYNLPFEPGTFDRVFVCFMIDLLPENDFTKLLKEFRRVLKKNSLLMVSYMTFGKNRITRFWDMMARNFPRLMTDCRPIDIIPNLKKTGFQIMESAYIVQNTFPSFVAAARKSETV